MQRQPRTSWTVLIMICLLAGFATSQGTGCTPEQAEAVLAGVQVATEQLNEEEDVSFGDWLSSELDD